MTYHVEHLFMSLFATHMSSLFLKKVHSDLLPIFLIEDFFFPIIKFEEFFSYPGEKKKKNTFIKYVIYKYFITVSSLIFIVSTMSFQE